MKKFGFCVLFIFWASQVVFGQSIDVGSSQNDSSHPADLIVFVSVDQIQSTAPSGINVELQDGSGTGAHSLATQQTDGSGRVVFHASTGTYNILVTGAGIAPYQAALEIYRMESSHTEHLIVRSVIAIPDKAQSEFKAGSKSLEAKDYPEAEKRFKQAVAIYPNYGVAYNGLGIAEMSLNHGPEARAAFEQAIKLDDKFAEAYRNLARIALAEHSFGEMDDLLTKSLQIDPSNAWALTYAAYAELQTHKFDLAITHARAAHAVPHPGLASVHIVAANAFEATQQPAEASKEYQLYLKEDPSGKDAPRAKDAIARLASSPTK
jgi:tetratricopeptide (TPR) repeat protein